jgi:hypothetical protein
MLYLKCTTGSRSRHSAWIVFFSSVLLFAQMNRNVPPIPPQWVVSAAVALAGIIAYVVALG